MLGGTLRPHQNYSIFSVEMARRIIQKPIVLLGLCLKKHKQETALIYMKVIG
jgi:hypothetical protein